MKARDLFLPLIAINILAVIIGFQYYKEQLSETPLHMLLFVPDCPLYVMLFLPIALGLVKNKEFAFLVSAGMVKYGLWTIFVLLFHSQYYLSPEVIAVTLLFIAGHAGMVAEGIAIAPKKIGTGAVLLVVASLLANDLADYAFGTVPPIPREGMEIVALLTIAASIAIPMLLSRTKLLQNPLSSLLARICVVPASSGSKGF